MENFNFSAETEIIFGENRLETLAQNILKNTTGPILLTYGGGTIKKLGLYDKVVEQLNSNGIVFYEVSGIKPNPEVDTVEAGVALIKEHNIDFLLCVGGGSVLDNTKHMAMCAKSDLGAWETLISGAHLQLTNVPKIGSIITLAATGSENNNGGVLSNAETKQKIGFFHPETKPVFAYEDPTILYNLPVWHRRAGVCDILSHLFETYFGTNTDDGITDRMIEAYVSNVINYYEQYIESNDYEAHAQMFITSSFALNGQCGIGKAKQDWTAHMLEHEVSAINDMTHGIGLAIIQPALVKYYFEQDSKNNNSLIKYENLGKNVFNCEANQVPDKMAALFADVSKIITFEDADAANFEPEVCAKALIARGWKHSWLDINEDEIVKIYNTMFETK